MLLVPWFGKMPLVLWRPVNNLPLADKRHATGTPHSPRPIIFLCISIKSSGDSCSISMSTIADQRRILQEAGCDDVRAGLAVACCWVDSTVSQVHCSSLIAHFRQYSFLCWQRMMKPRGFGARIERDSNCTSWCILESCPRRWLPIARGQTIVALPSVKRSVPVCHVSLQIRRSDRLVA